MIHPVPNDGSASRTLSSAAVIGRRRVFSNDPTEAASLRDAHRDGAPLAISRIPSNGNGLAL
jgi:hypothetical protein